MSGTPDSAVGTDAPSRFRVLLIGIDAYPDLPLKGCVNDINAFAQFLCRDLNVPADAITKLTAPLDPPQPDPALRPTKARIVAALQALAAAPDLFRHQVLIYYSGHGTQRYFAQAEANYEALVPVGSATIFTTVAGECCR